MVLNDVQQYGVEVFPQPTGEIWIDMDDEMMMPIIFGKKQLLFGKNTDRGLCLRRGEIGKWR